MRTFRLGGVVLVTLAVLSLAAPGEQSGEAARFALAPATAQASVEHLAPALLGLAVEPGGEQDDHQQVRGDAVLRHPGDPAARVIGVLRCRLF